MIEADRWGYHVYTGSTGSETGELIANGKGDKIRFEY